MESPPFAGPVTGRYAPREYFAGWFTLFAGVLLPAFTVGFELVTHLCANTLFDPLPTTFHLAMVVAVPAINLKLWMMQRKEEKAARGWLFAGAAAAAVGFGYAILFLPVYPVSVVGILWFGLGLLPFAPLAAAITALALVLRLGRQEGQPVAGLVAGGMLAGFFLQLSLDVPTAITRYAVRAHESSEGATRAGAMDLMRNLGSRELLLRYCYDRSFYASGLLGLVLDRSYQGGHSVQAARELYYRITGEMYDGAPPPWNARGWRFTDGFDWDPDQGGAQVGRRLAGLSLASSRIDGSMDADDAVAYLEWTAEFANAEEWQQREARLTLALPPGGVVSRATLWVNGVEREASFASRGLARAAYENVVRARRDPLLVTTNGADQVLIQMFPVPAKGESRIRIGMTVPLALTADDRASLVMPAIIDRNFSISGDLRHAVWIEGDGRESRADAGFSALAADGAQVRLRGNFSDAQLTRERPRISLARNAKAESMSSGKVVQTIQREPREPAGSLYVLLDGSARAVAGRAALMAALDHIPQGARVGFGVASRRPASLPLDSWSPARRAALLDLLDSQPFDGGEDNVVALADALAQLAGQPRATVLWVHGPQPWSFGESTLEQVLDRGTRLPDLWLLPIAPGPNQALRDARLFAQANTLAWSGDPAVDIARAFDDYFDARPRWTIRREPASSPGVPRGSAHVEKLWASQEVVDLIARHPAQREAAIALASEYRLVTPVSGAVVLETDVEYLRAGLTPPDPTAVPTIPEPETWAMLILACLAFAWALRQRRRIRA